MPIRWTDLDAYGHLNNSIFLDFMTEARANLLKDVLNMQTMCQFVIAHISCDYKHPFYYPDTIMLKQFCEAKSSSSFTLRYEFYSTRKPNTLHTIATAKMVAFDPVKARPTRLPKQVLTLLESEVILTP